MNIIVFLMQYIFFIIFSLLTILPIFYILISKNTLYSAVALIFSFSGIAGFYALLSAPFLSLIQLLVYAGAIMVLFVFAIMLIDIGEKRERKTPFSSKVAIILSIVFGIQILLPILNLTGFMPPSISPVNLKDIGKMLFSEYLYPFEITSLLILAALVAGIVIARRES